MPSLPIPLAFQRDLAVILPVPLSDFLELRQDFGPTVPYAVPEGSEGARRCERSLADRILPKTSLALPQDDSHFTFVYVHT
jgi:hypothetical protein